MPIPTRRFAILAVGFAVAMVVLPVPLPSTAGWTVIMTNVVLLALGVLDAFVAPAARRFEVERTLPPAVTSGHRAPMRWTVTNTSRRSARIHLADELAPSLGAATRRVTLRIGAGETAEVSTELHPERRGRFSPSRIALRVEGPLGLMARQRELDVPGVLRVLPPFHSRDEAELRIRRARILEVGQRSARGLGGGTDFEQLREYGPDDEFRRIDWAATARSGRAIVRTYRAERNQQVVVMLDNGRVMAGRTSGVPRLEWAMDAAMMLAHVAVRLGDRCGMVVFDHGVRSVVPAARRAGQGTRMAEAMFDLEPRLLESDYMGAFTETVVRFRRRSLIVLLTDLVEQAVGEHLLPALPVITRRHLVIVGAVRDPEVERWALVEPRDAEEAYRKAAAVSSLAERDRTAARLRGLGVQVVDAAPDRLAAELADAYLEVKGAGRL